MSREIRADELAALKEIAEMLNSMNDMNVMLNAVLVKLLEVTSFTTGWIFLLDEHSDSICAAAQNLPSALAENDNAAMCGEGCWCTESYRQNKLNRAVNIIECSRIVYAAEYNAGDKGGLTHHATVPLKAGAESFGLLNAAQAGKEFFSKEELALLQAVAYQIGTAIKRIRLYQVQERNALLYAKLGEVITRIHAVQDISQLPLKAVEHISAAFDWPQIALFVYEQDRLSLRAYYDGQQTREGWQQLDCGNGGVVADAFHQNRLVVVADSKEEAVVPLTAKGLRAFTSAAAIPLRRGSCPYGVLFISSRDNGQFDHYPEEFMYALGEHLTLSIDNLRVIEQRRELARMEERIRMARDLHDSVMQKIFSMSFIAKGAEKILGGKDPIVERSLQEMASLSQETLGEMRTLIWQLHPAGLENGLLPALKQYGERMNLIVHAEAEGLKELPRALEEGLWRIGQEGLNNIRKHADANAAYIRLVKSEREVTLEIEDHGRGFSPKQLLGQTMGMLSMRERAEALGGEFIIHSEMGQRTVIRASIPLAAEEGG
ncbi:GAF domain-containing sensor histidine kinase [Paenibacillus algorifonticola]|uniref:GAF domain-containing sensor histidine kinase n=1 Tax=Paenibacillus algorifonticola TaxID=684063 RepID=UPI003D291ABC